MRFVENGVLILEAFLDEDLETQLSVFPLRI